MLLSRHSLQNGPFNPGPHCDSTSAPPWQPERLISTESLVSQAASSDALCDGSQSRAIAKPPSRQRLTSTESAEGRQYPGLSSRCVSSLPQAEQSTPTTHGLQAASGPVAFIKYPSLQRHASRVVAFLSRVDAFSGHRVHAFSVEAPDNGLNVPMWHAMRSPALQ